jgi:hypothetical protein
LESQALDPAIHEVDSTVVLARVINGYEMGVIERGDILRFPGEPSLLRSPDRPSREFQRHVPLQPGVPGSIDPAEAAFSGRPPGVEEEPADAGQSTAIPTRDVGARVRRRGNSPVAVRRRAEEIDECRLARYQFLQPPVTFGGQQVAIHFPIHPDAATLEELHLRSDQLLHFAGVFTQSRNSLHQIGNAAILPGDPEAQFEFRADQITQHLPPVVFRSPVEEVLGTRKVQPSVVSVSPGPFKHTLNDEWLLVHTKTAFGSVGSRVVTARGAASRSEGRGALRR